MLMTNGFKLPKSGATWGALDVIEAVAWAEQGFSPDEASKWQDRKFSAWAAVEWAQRGFSPKEADRWVKAGCWVEQALAWKQAGYIPEEI